MHGPASQGEESVRQLAQAQLALAQALDAARSAGERYFAAPLSTSTGAREAYYDALRRQWEAERAFYEAKGRLSRTGPSRV